MKIGFVFECGPDGADKQVIVHFAKKIAPSNEIEWATLDNKGKLLRECGEAVERLLATGCEKVFVCWDLIPPNTGACRKNERDTILQKLNESGLPLDNIVLLCIEQELEAWLIADGNAIATCLSTPAHPIRIKDNKTPDRDRNPKKYLTRLFHEHRGKPYTDYVNAIQIARKIADYSKIKNSESFSRFYYKLTGKQVK